MGERSGVVKVQLVLRDEDVTGFETRGPDVVVVHAGDFAAVLDERTLRRAMAVLDAERAQRAAPAPPPTVGRKLTLADLKDGTVVRARWGREGPESPAWGEWRAVKLFVARYPARPPRRGKQGRPGHPPVPGKIAVLALKELDGRPVDWAEYGQDDFEAYAPAHGQPLDGNGVFLVEDYYLEVEGLTA